MLKAPSQMNLALHELKHGWRHFIVFLSCLMLGVAVITTVNSLGASLKEGLAEDAQSLLGGDIELTISSGQLDQQQQDFLKAYGKVSHIATLRAMLQSAYSAGLVEVKAIDDLYPLLGKLELDDKMGFTVDELAIDKSLLSQLNIKSGDSVTLGTKTYRTAALITKEPDRVVQIFSLGPRVLLSHAALQESGLISPYSLIKHSYRILLDDKSKAEEIKKQFELRYPDTLFRSKSGTDGNNSLKRFTDQLIAFLELSGLATFLIGGIGIGTSVRRYMEKKAQSIAIMKALGAKGNTILLIYLKVLAMLSLIGCICGTIISAITSSILTPIIARILPAIEAGSFFHFNIAALSFWYGILIVYIFSVPALFAALGTKPATLFRSSVKFLQLQLTNKIIVIEIVLINLLIFTLFINATDKLFIAGAIIVILFTLLLFSLCAQLVKYIARKAAVKRLWLRLALNNLYRPGAATGTAILVIGISLTVLVALKLTEANFQERIRNVVDRTAPSLFMIDIQEEQKTALLELLYQHTDETSVTIYPVISGRITELNGKPISEKDVAEDVRWAVRGDRSLSYSATPPANADIIQGEWWPADYSGKPLVSVDERFLKGMNLKMGDTISLNVLGQEVIVTIANARHIDYTTFQINFAMMLSPGILENMPHTNMATVYLNPEQNEDEIVRSIARQFPGVSIIRTKETIELVKNVMENIATAMSIAVLITMVTGLLVLTAAMSSMLEQKLYDTAILKTLGARKKEILKINSAEWLMLGLAASLIAAFIGTVSSWLVIRRFPGEGFFFMPDVTLLTILACLAVIWLIAYIGNRQIFSFRPARLLRNE